MFVVEPPPGRLTVFPHVGALVGVAVAGFSLSYVVAAQDPVPSWELHLTQRINGPDGPATFLYPVMQFGTLGGPILVAAALGVFRRDWWPSGATIVSGVVTWFATKGVKQSVDRGHTGAYLSEFNIREGEGTGLGDISGHSAVAACAALMAMSAMPARWCPALAFLAVPVGLARIVHGVHLPADVVGGWRFGALIALASLAVLDRIEPGRRSSAIDRAEAA